ncbi:hypothetical protein [Burkholderia singularis]|uniref:hypothetical protein n=1 Tax=Burkholderia singularis TaxID=1503053 RepID=UPI000B7724E9|nr:hypothetical protein [Burkholderia singularis]
MKHDQSHFDELERLLRTSLQSVAKNLSDKDQADICEYLDHGEYGVAYELLDFVLDKQHLERPTTLVEAGRKMGMIG